MTDKLMEQTNNYLEEYGVAKGYSVRELRQRKVTTIPDNMKDRYKTFEAVEGEGAPPVETTVTLNFKEMELITRERVFEGF